MTKDERDLLIRIDERLKEMHEDIAGFNKNLHGNGQPGLLQRVQALEDFHKNESGFFKRYGGFLGWVITTLVALYSVFKHHS